MSSNDELISRIDNSIENLKELIKAIAGETEEKVQLRNNRNTLRSERNRLVHANIQHHSQNYSMAIDALDSASTQIQDAINDIAQVAEAIRKVAAVVDTLNELRPA